MGTQSAGAAASSTSLREALIGIQRTSPLEIEHDCARRSVRQRYFAPRTLDELARLYEEHPAAVLLAGGTDVGLWVTKKLRALHTIIYVAGVEALRRIAREDRYLVIGAAVNYRRLRECVAQRYPAFAALISRIGSEQVRELGTIGGNIANGSPVGDTPPPLIALGARLRLRKGATTRDIPLEDYFVSYGVQSRQPAEFVESILLPLPSAQLRFGVFKISKRFDQDISAVCAAFALTVENDTILNARICYGGMAGIPKRASRCESALIGKQWKRETFDVAAAALEHDFTPLSDMRASAAYRIRAAKNLLVKFYLMQSGERSVRMLDSPPEASDE